MSKNIITVTANGKIIGVVQDVQWKYEAAHNSFTCTRIRFDRMRISSAFGQDFVSHQNQTQPLQITVEHDNKIMSIHNAWITDSSYVYETNDWIIAESISMEAEDITCVDKDFVLCKFCVRRPDHI